MAWRSEQNMFQGPEIPVRWASRILSKQTTTDSAPSSGEASTTTTSVHGRHAGKRDADVGSRPGVRDQRWTAGSRSARRALQLARTPKASRRAESVVLTYLGVQQRTAKGWRRKSLSGEPEA